MRHLCRAIDHRVEHAEGRGQLARAQQTHVDLAVGGGGDPRREAVGRGAGAGAALSPGGDEAPALQTLRNCRRGEGASGCSGYRGCSGAGPGSDTEGGLLEKSTAAVFHDDGSPSAGMIQIRFDGYDLSRWPSTDGAAPQTRLKWQSGASKSNGVKGTNG